MMQSSSSGVANTRFAQGAYNIMKSSLRVIATVAIATLIAMILALSAQASAVWGS